MIMCVVQVFDLWVWVRYEIYAVCGLIRLIMYVYLHYL